MADEELLALARDKGALVEAARLALESELKKRSLSAEAEPVAPAEPVPPPPAEPADQWRRWKTAFEKDEASPPKEILARTGRLHEFYLQTFRLYRDHFRLFASLIIPAGLVTYGLWVARWFADHALIRNLFDPRFRGMSPGVLAALTVVNLSTGFSGWVVLCAAFASIIAAVSELVQGRTVRAVSCYLILRQRLGPFVRTTLLLGLLVGIGLLVATGVTTVLILTAQRWGYRSLILLPGLTLALLGLVFGVLARVAFTMPAVMLDRLNAYAGLKRSDALGDHFLLRIWLVMMECEVTTYLLVVLVQRVENLVFTGPVRGWESYALGIGGSLLGSLLQVPMMIAFTLLYLRARSSHEARVKN